MTINQLPRCLTSRKISAVNFLLDYLEQQRGIVTGRYMIEMLRLDRKNDTDETSLWNVHYVLVGDGERVIKQERLTGSYQGVMSLFLLDLLIR